jgi:hypothetical protein
MSRKNTIVKQNSFDIVKNEGHKLLEDNEFFKDLSDIMENETFAKFFRKYFCDSTESKITLIYMKLYDEFKIKWKELNDSELDKRINTFLLWRIMKDRKMNKFTIQTVLNKLENPKNSNEIFDELKEFIQISENTMTLK